VIISNNAHCTVSKQFIEIAPLITSTNVTADANSKVEPPPIMWPLITTVSIFMVVETYKLHSYRNLRNVIQCCFLYSFIKFADRRLAVYKPSPQATLLGYMKRYTETQSNVHVWLYRHRRNILRNVESVAHLYCGANMYGSQTEQTGWLQTVTNIAKQIIKAQSITSTNVTADASSKPLTDISKLHSHRMFGVLHVLLSEYELLSTLQIKWFIYLDTIKSLHQCHGWW